MLNIDLSNITDNEWLEYRIYINEGDSLYLEQDEECKICSKKHNRNSNYCSQTCYYKDWYSRNKDRKRNYKKHPRKKLTIEEKKEYKRNYYQKNRERILSYQKEYQKNRRGV